jgi:hypothetical protein
MANYKRQQLEQTHSIKTERRKKNKAQTVGQNVAIYTINKNITKFQFNYAQKLRFSKEKV